MDYIDQRKSLVYANIHGLAYNRLLRRNGVHVYELDPFEFDKILVLDLI